MAPSPNGVGPIICSCTLIPWVIVFYMWAFNAMDPANCWVSEGQLWVSQNATGLANETNVAETWRTFFVIMFWTHLAMTLLLCFAGSALCGGEKTQAIGTGCGGLGCCTILAKWGFWIWALILRFGHEGSVASGSMIDECRNANPGIAAGQDWQDSLSDAMSTEDGSSRLL